MLIFCSNRLLVGGNGFQNFAETINAMWWERDGFRRSINEPPQDDFGCSQSGIALLHFLERSELLTKSSIVIVKRSKHSIKRAEKNAFYPSTCPYIALDEPAKVVRVNVPVT